MKLKLTGNKKTVEPLAKSFEKFFHTEPKIQSAGGGEGDKEKVIADFNIKDSEIHKFLTKIKL